MAKQPIKRRWWEVGKGLIGLANLQIVVLLFQQLNSLVSIEPKPFNLPLAFAGIAIWLWLYSLALIVMKGGDKK